MSKSAGFPRVLKCLDRATVCPWRPSGFRVGLIFGTIKCRYCHFLPSQTVRSEASTLCRASNSTLAAAALFSAVATRTRPAWSSAKMGSTLHGAMKKNIKNHSDIFFWNFVFTTFHRNTMAPVPSTPSRGCKWYSQHPQPGKCQASGVPLWASLRSTKFYTGYCHSVIPDGIRYNSSV